MENKTTEIAVRNTLNAVLPVNEIRTAYDAKLVVNTALRITGRVNLAICKAFAIVNDKKLYRDEYKTLEKFGKIFGMSKSNVYNYVKVGALVADNGAESILPHLKKDFGYTQLVVIAEKLEKEEAIQLANDGIITPDMSVEKLKKAIKQVKGGENLTDEIETEIISEKVDEKADEKTDEKADEKADEKVEKKLNPCQQKFVDNIIILATAFAKGKSPSNLTLDLFIKSLKPEKTTKKD